MSPTDTWLRRRRADWTSCGWRSHSLRADISLPADNHAGPPFSLNDPGKHPTPPSLICAAPPRDVGTLPASRGRGRGGGINEQALRC